MKNSNVYISSRISEAKGIPIVDFLTARNIKPIKWINQELLYHSPIRNEKTPSFYVNPQKNRFNDFGGTEEMRGDSIRLVMQMDKCGFSQAVVTLLSINYPSSAPFSFSGQDKNDEQRSGINILKVDTLQSAALIRYVISRGIQISLALKYLHEIHFESKGRKYFAVGFKNDNQGYELRNGLGFKGKTRNGITCLDMNTDSVSVFEGFFDFLSALSFYGLEMPTKTAIILNTTANLNLALPLLSSRKLINCFLNNNTTGKKCLDKLINYGFQIKDWSSVIYPNYKDFNEFLIERRKL